MKNKNIKKRQTNCVIELLCLYFTPLLFWNFIICKIVPWPFAVESSECITRNVGNVSLNFNCAIITTKFLGIKVF